MEIGFSYDSLVSPQCVSFICSLWTPCLLLYILPRVWFLRPTVLERSFLIGDQQCHSQTSNALLPKTLPSFGCVVLREGRCIVVASSCTLSWNKDHLWVVPVWHPILAVDEWDSQKPCFLLSWWLSETFLVQAKGELIGTHLVSLLIPKDVTKPVGCYYWYLYLLNMINLYLHIVIIIANHK